jgi:hypothetical protein
MKSKGKPRNPFVTLAKFRKAGSHAKPMKSLRRQEKWHQRISTESAFAMISASLIPMRMPY